MHQEQELIWFYVLGYFACLFAEGHSLALGAVKLEHHGLLAVVLDAVRERIGLLVLFHVQRVDIGDMFYHFAEVFDDDAIHSLFQVSQVSVVTLACVLDTKLHRIGAVDCQDEASVCHWVQVFVVSPVAESFPGQLFVVSYAISDQLNEAPFVDPMLAVVAAYLKHFPEVTTVHYLAERFRQKLVDFLDLKSVVNRELFKAEEQVLDGQQRNW